MFIFSNLAMSLDGKIATQNRKLFPLGTPEDLKEMQVLRMRSEAVLMGATTLREYRKPCWIEGKKRPLINAVVSTNLKGFSVEWEFFKAKALKRILFVGPESPSARIRKFAKSSEIVTLRKPSKKNPLATQIITALEKAGVQRLLIEGGGELMWSFASLNLIDEYHVTLTPRILGGRAAPTLIDGLGFSPAQSLNLKLRQCRLVGDEIFLTYQKISKKG